MKKFFVSIITILMAAVLIGCNTASSFIEFSSDKPWGQLESYERCEYDIEIVEGTGEKRKFADGKLIYELTQYTDSEGVDTIKLTSDFSVTYLGEDYIGNDKLATDKIKSEVHFINQGLGPLTSEKTVSLGVRKNDDGTYQANNSYNVNADYTTLKAESHKGKTVNSDGTLSESYIENKSFPLSSNAQAYDNEQLYYIARALKKLSSSSSISTEIINIYEIAATIDSKNKYKTTPITYSVAEQKKTVELNESFIKDYLTPDDDGKYFVSCQKVSVAKSGTNAGPAFTLYITEPAVEFTRAGVKTSRIITEMQQVQYNVFTREVAFYTNYTLVNYSTVNPA